MKKYFILKIIFAIFLLPAGTLLHAQNCNYTLKGHITARNSHEGLPYASVYVTELGRGVICDEHGSYKINNICPGNYHIKISDVECEPLVVNVLLSSDLIKDFELPHSIHELKTANITAKKQEKPSATTDIAEIKGKQLDETRGQSLGESLKQISGVSSVQTGPTISKPIIHGVYGNRILIVNNDVRQEGQQWGADHAPEIDAFVASKLSVVKGAASIRYGSDAIGGVILVEPPRMKTAGGIDGEVNLVGMSTGKMGVASGMLQGAFDNKVLSGLSWRIQGTLRKAGNFSTPNYILDNTGFFENSYSGGLSYTKNNFGAEIYYSHFYTRLGIFSGSHISSIADLQAAIASPRPIYIPPFTYNVDRPYQSVNHELLKTKIYYNSETSGSVTALFSRQEDERSEYDYLSFSNRTTPALYLKIISHSLNISWEHPMWKNFKGVAGVSGSTQGNVRDFEFLIPNFRNYGTGIFLLEKYIKNNWIIEAGIRYDYRWLRAYLLDVNTAQIITPTTDYHNTVFSAGFNYHFSPQLKLIANACNSWRAPTVNELYSYGVHQGTASFEKGNKNLNSEKAVCMSSGIEYTKNKITINITAYDNYFSNYIYLKPDLKFVHTIRGSFPSFSYTQVAANFKGIDADFRITVYKNLFLQTKISYINAYNEKEHTYLIFIPANRIENILRCEFHTEGVLQEPYIAVSNLSVGTQKNVPVNGDYAPPPLGYSLFGCRAGAAVHIGKQHIDINFEINNLFNVAYRDYLNRFRYYADEVGRNYTLRLKMPFSFEKQQRQK